MSDVLKKEDIKMTKKKDKKHTKQGNYKKEIKRKTKNDGL